MADPAQVEDVDVEASQSNEKPATDLVEGFGNLNIIRQAGLMVGLAASVAIGFAVVLWVQGDDYRPLYASMDHLDSGQVTELLEMHDIQFKVDPKTGVMLVSSDQIHKARLKLAAAGLPGDKSVGFELLDQEQPLGTSQFMETTRYRRGLEGELARTISSIRTVRGARVHLAIPRTSVFVRDQREPSASVFLDLYAGLGIKPEQVTAIANLVASSIPELKVENVSIVDQRGNLLTIDDTSVELIAANKQREYVRRVERDINGRINSILEPVVGSGSFKAEVSADVDFTEVEQAEEIYNPDMPAVRSEQTLDERRVGDQFGGIPGALTNQPPGVNADAPEEAEPKDDDNGKSSTARKQATRNYELDRTVSYTRHQIGKIRRLSVAVVVDDRETIDPETGKLVRQPWSVNELERLSILVRDAVGYSAARGDSVNVLNSAFMIKSEEVEMEMPWYEHPLLQQYSKHLVGLFIVVMLIFGFLKPIMKSLSNEGRRKKEEEMKKEVEALESGSGLFDSLSDESVTLTGGDTLMLPSPEESYEQQLNAIKGLIAEDAGRVALVIKRWVTEPE
ncbi:MAG: flagellar M-ring protein FliF [Cellvibrionaceae bacterium]